MRKQLTGLVKRGLPYAFYRKLVHYSRNPPVGRVDFGDLRSVQPISREWGLDRGRPVDRYYIEKFLAASAPDIRGRVLEIGTNTYTLLYGANRVTKSDVLHVSAEDPRATIVADLRSADHVPSDIFDCIICTQTLHFIYDVGAVVQTLHRILKPGGILLVTTPGVSQISRYDMDRWGDYWRFTSASATRLFGACFDAGHVNISTFGNVLAAIAFLHGIAADELQQEELDVFDPDYEVLIGVRAAKTQSRS